MTWKAKKGIGEIKCNNWITSHKDVKEKMPTSLIE